MQKSLRLFSVTVLLLLLASPVMAGQYTSDFSDYVASLNRQQQTVSAVISMADQVDLRALQDRLYAEGADRRAWHEAVVLALQDKATSTQADIIARLDEMVLSGQVAKFQPFWISNIIVVSATPTALDELVARQDVDQIAPDYAIETIEPVSKSDDEPIIASHEVGLERIHADQCWAMGITGQGRLVSNIDTGVLGSHEALTDRWAGNDPRYAGHPEWAWLDPYTTNWPTPNDVGGHGTHTMGTICGRTPSGDTIGVAIDAQWIAAAAIDRGGGIPRTVADAIASFEWIADPDSNPGTVWDVPDACSNSWGVTTSHGYPPCDETFWTVIDGCEAVGVVVVFAAGNEGPTASSLRRPADRATTLYSTFSVGAVDGATENMPIASFSSRGPSSCTPDGSSTIKPEVCAPGVNVRSSYDNGGYTTMSGTSMACPHVAGVVALIRQANPNLTSEQVKRIMYETAVECPADANPGEDNTFGMGVVNAYAAVQLALAYLDGWGTIGGIVTDQASGNPLQGARISVIDRPWTASTRANGQFYLFVPADSAWTLRVENPPTHLPVFDTITVAENETTSQNYALEGKVTATLRASFANPQNTGYRAFYIKGSWNSDGFYDAGWSAPAIAIRDNGVAPDQVAGDGIFTGNVLLARDLAHTYNWAIYSENYGGEGAKLQNGAGFQIPNLNPPTVPTLAVNPSGSDNNWVITAFGDNGLNLDLVQGFGGQPAKWGASMILTNGVTYTFRFRAMHSPIASYGLGGIGGADITFTCAFTDNYEFTFDDRDDSYRLRLIGHPEPTNLTAASGEEFQVPLRWRLPEASGRAASMLNYLGDQSRQDVDFPDALAKDAIEPEYPPMVLGRGGPDTFGYEWVDSDEPDGPAFDWVDITVDGVEITPWPHGTVDDGYTDPIPMGMDFEFYGVTYTDIVVSTNGWISFLPTTSAHLGNEAIPNNTTPQAIVAVEWDDLDGGSVGHCYYYYDSGANRFIVSWVGWPYYPDATGAQHDIQVILNGSGSIITQYGTNAGAWQTDVTVGIENDLGTDGLQVTYNAGYLHSDMAIRYATGPEGTAPVHYNIYRATTPNVPIDPAHLINGNVEGSLTSYLDTYNIVNGQPYYYKMTAIWGDSVASPPSNEATGTPANHPPIAPTALAGGVNNRTVSLVWSHNDAVGDMDHFNVYKKLLPTGTWTLVGSSPDTAHSFDIPLGEDGIYAFTVSAVDDGTPQLESAYAHEIQMPVGHLPPTGLVAVSGHESAVPLAWNLPGGFRADSPDAPPMTLGRGGPDTFGYEWVDSDETDGPTFDWIDITADGVEITPWPHGTVDNGYTDLMPMGMEFEFYGTVYTDIVVGTNGWVSFQAQTLSHSANEAIPNSTTPQAYIAVEWDDLDGGSVGHCYYYYDAAMNRFIVSWVGWPYYPDPTDPRDFQVILHGNSGKIITQYQNGTNWQSDVTVGIENADGTDGLQVTYNTAYLHNDLAIRFSTGSEGFQPVHYKLYRATTENFPIGPSYLINGSVGGTLTAYTDTSNLTNGTQYYYKLTAVWEDSVESSPSNEATAIPTWGARMVANPLSFNVIGMEGVITTSNLNISNPGGQPLMYNIMATTDLVASAPKRSHVEGTIQNVKPADEVEVEDKDAEDPNNPPMLLSRGGPDAFGYSWIDSDEPGGPAFNWIDISVDGVEITPWPHGTVDDGYTDPIPMGMDFPFYGVTYPDIVVSTNGWISFLPTTSSHLSNEAIPNNTTPQAIVAVEWDDQDGGTVGHCYYYYDAANNQFIVSWVGWPYYPDATGAQHDFQVILKGNGRIMTQYGTNAGEWQSDVTVGIENHDGTDGLQVTYNAAYLHSDMAIMYTTGWLSTNPISGTIDPGANQDISVIFDASTLAQGDYSGSLVLSGRDAFHQVSSITIPVTFHVEPNTGIDDGSPDLPKAFALAQNYPNPFNPTTEIKFELPIRAFVNLEVFNVLGQKVRTLVDSDLDAGYRTVIWNGADDGGQMVSSGTYFYILKAGGKTFTKKMTMIK